MNIQNVMAVTDTLVTKYGKPVAASWHKYATAKSIGWAAGVGFGLFLWLIAVILCIWSLTIMNRLRNEGNTIDEFGWRAAGFAVCAIYVISFAIYVGSYAVDFGLAMYYPDAYWIIDAIKPAPGGAR